MAINNSISLITKFVPFLDEAYKQAAKSSVLDAQGIEFVGANSVKVFKLSMNGMGNYNRNTGYVDGDVTGTWETLTLSKDRGRRFMVDSQSDEESAGLAFGRLLGEFVRTKVAPEIDAYRFSSIAGASSITTASAKITLGTTNCLTLVATAQQVLNENEVPEDGRILFVSPTMYEGIKAGITRYVLNDEKAINKTIEMYDNCRVIMVAPGRFNTKITLYDGTTAGQTAGGYILTPSTGYPINFILMHPSAVVAAVKHNVGNIIPPAANQTADGWILKYRCYHDIFVLENKVKGIYVHYDTTANA